jgi:uncharacterized protein YdeI (YjbR/CyaY-like superfamily)
MSIKKIETYCPKNRTDWRNWLEKNHQSKKAVWLVYYKVSSKSPSITWGEAVDEALCFGWIDSTKKTIDDVSYMQYFSKRKPFSNWSKVNKEKIANLIQNNRMEKAGFDSIEIAKQNGSWTKLDEIEALIIPFDLKEQLINHKNAADYFENLSQSMKKLLLNWVASAKREETRRKRISEIVDSAKQNTRPKQFR